MKIRRDCRFIIVSSLLWAWILPAVADEAPLLTIETVAEGVYAFRPTEEAFATWRAVSNSGAVVLDDGVLIYDSHWTPAHVEEARKLLRRHTDKPVRYVVQSHFHGDHTGGAWAFAEGVEIITHHTTRERLAQDLAELPEKLPKEIAERAEQIEAIEDPAQRARVENVQRYDRELLARLERGDPARLPTLTFERRVDLHRGREVEIYFLGRGHTAGDALVFLPGEKVAFLGDLLFVRTLPNVNDGFTREWIETLRAVLELGAERFVPGHGELTDAAGVRAQIAYLEWLRAAVEPYAKDAAGVEAALAGVALPEKYAGYRFPFFFRANVAKVYREMVEEP